MAQKVEYGTVTTALDAIALNGTEANRTSAALEVIQHEGVRIQYGVDGLDGSGIAAADTVYLRVLISIDNGTTYREALFTKSDQTQEQLKPPYAVTGADVSAGSFAWDWGSLSVSGATHIKVIGETDGTADGDNKITVVLVPWRE